MTKKSEYMISDTQKTRTYLNILQRDDASRLLIRRVLKVIETVVIQDEPPSLPRLIAATCRQKHKLQLPLATTRKRYCRGRERKKFRGPKHHQYLSHSINFRGEKD